MVCARENDSSRDSAGSVTEKLAVFYLNTFLQLTCPPRLLGMLVGFVINLQKRQQQYERGDLSASGHLVEARTFHQMGTILPPSVASSSRS